MSTRLSQDIRTGFDQATASVDQHQLVGLRIAVRRATKPESDELLLPVVRSYRLGPKELWAPVLLELLVPAIMASLVLLQPFDDVVSEEDIRQQLVLEVLEAAALAPIPTGARYIERRLMMRAAYLTSRWLRRQRRHHRFRQLLDEVNGS